MVARIQHEAVMYSVQNDSEVIWLLAQIRPNSYRIAERNLQRQAFRTFLPMQEETRRVRGKFLTKLRPLFPGYLFVAIDSVVGGWSAVNSTIGITRLVSVGETPAAVPVRLVSDLMLRCDPDGKLLPARTLKPGDRVTVINGPFADFAASIERLAPDRRVWLLLDLMGRETRVAVDPEQLRGV